MSKLRDVAYQIDPALWVHEALGVQPAAWQAEFLRAPQGSSILALTARQVGKTTTAAWAMTHTALHIPNSLSVVACPAQRQSAEAVRRVKDSLVKVGAKLKSDNVYGLELENGSRVLALPGSDDLVRGLTVDGWIIADEAARLGNDLIAAVRPMRARQPKARLAMLSTAWSRTDPFWTAWASDDDFMDPAQGHCRYRCHAICGGFFGARTPGAWGRRLQARISRYSGGWSHQSLHLGDVRAGDASPRPAGATGARLYAGRGAASANSQSLQKAQNSRRRSMRYIPDDPRTWSA